MSSAVLGFNSKKEKLELNCFQDYEKFGNKLLIHTQDNRLICTSQITGGTKNAWNYLLLCLNLTNYSLEKNI